MKAVFASLLISAVAAGAAWAGPQTASSTYTGPPTMAQRCEAIAVEYRTLRAQGRLQGDVRREVLRRFHQTGCFGEPMMVAVNNAPLTAGRR